jgi:hypothetical protein
MLMGACSRMAPPPALFFRIDGGIFGKNSLEW